MDLSWVAPRMTDGLGNRFFQIAAAISIAETLKRRVVIFLPSYLKTGHGEYDLVFQLCPEIPIVESANRWIQVDEKLEVPENNSGLGIVIKGYFQNIKYFPDYRHPLLPSLPKPLLKPFSRKVAVHFRFGDYTFLQHHQIPLEYYYMKAIEKFSNPKESSAKPKESSAKPKESSAKETEFVLFSDSPEKLQPIFEELCKKGYKVSISNVKGVLETLLEIASCAGGFIGANSTFSWWASFLSWKSQNFSSDYKAYFPDTWMSDTKPNLFTLPFTKSLEVKGGESQSKLESFRYR
jgi:hypothetical protein